MGLNLGQTAREATSGVVNYGGFPGSPTPQGQQPVQGPPASGGGGGRAGGSIGGLSGRLPQIAQDAFGVTQSLQDAFSPTAVAAPGAVQQAGRVGGGGPDPYPTPVRNTVQQPTGYTRMGDLYAPPPVTSGGPSGIPTGGS